MSVPLHISLGVKENFQEILDDRLEASRIKRQKKKDIATATLQATLQSNVGTTLKKVFKIWENEIETRHAILLKKAEKRKNVAQ